MRKAAVATLARLERNELRQYAALLSPKLAHADAGVRYAVVETLGALGPSAVGTNAADPTIGMPDGCHALTPLAVDPVCGTVGMLAHPDGAVRFAAIDTLSHLDARSLAQHATAVSHRLRDPDLLVRKAAVRTLGRLDPESLAAHATAVAVALTDAVASVRRAATETLTSLDHQALISHKPTLRELLDDDDEDVRDAATRALAKIAAQQTGKQTASRLGWPLGRASSRPNTR